MISETPLFSLRMLLSQRVRLHAYIICIPSYWLLPGNNFYTGQVSTSGDSSSDDNIECGLFCYLFIIAMILFLAAMISAVIPVLGWLKQKQRGKTTSHCIMVDRVSFFTVFDDKEGTVSLPLEKVKPN